MSEPQTSLERASERPPAALQAHTTKASLAANAGVDHLDPEEIIDVLRWDAQGLTQLEIANRFNPPRHQSTISRCLTKWGTDTTIEAKRIFKAKAAQNAIRITEEGTPRDLIEVAKGIHTLDIKAVEAAMQLVVGVNLPGLPAQSVATFACSTQQLSDTKEPLTVATGSDNKKLC